VRVSSKKDTINEGWLCAKGRFGYGFVNSPERLKKPLIRIAPKENTEDKKMGRWEYRNQLPNFLTSHFREASWDEALEYIAKRLQEIKKHSGPDAIGGLSSARCTNEENYLFQKFIRAVIGTNNIDHCARY